jgi:eukaryotic-like serine/threonine-protein kinase
MPLSTGTRLGPYEILATLGVGGMGEVYRAADAKLGRAVALKVLSPALAGDADYMARFTREAQVLASLNHPNIAAIYGLEESDGVRALVVMELVEGLTLAERIAAGPVLLEETLHIARQIAEALEAAHEKGVVHRDLKPANVKITPEGVVKVLDFGLAKAAEAAMPISPNSPTLTIRATQAGLIMGTAGYMSPEQAAARPVDKRADIWSFGVVLCEMVTGRRVFNGEDAPDTLAAVVRAQPDLTGVPRRLRKLLESCLEKDPRKRLRDIGDAWKLVDEPLAGDGSTRRSSLRRISGVAAAAILLALAGWGAAYFKRGDSDTTVVRFIIPPPVSRVGGFEGVTVSPDGCQPTRS